MKTIQISNGYDTLIVVGLHETNLALATCSQFIKSFPSDSISDFIEVDIWEGGVIIESRAFVCVENEIPNIENFLYGV